MTLSSISRKHGFQVVSRVMLERPRDYKQELVDLGCDPYDLGTVTWNSATHAVDVSGSVDLDGKGLTRLPFQFGKVGGYFWCSHNRLTSLEGCPKEVGKDFWCYHNQLTSLDGAPEKVGGNFGCHSNQLTSLEGCPEKVGGGFGCSTDDLTDVSALRGCKIKGDIYLDGPKADQVRVTKLLRASGFKGEIR
jgi:hypothetical protein